MHGICSCMYTCSCSTRESGRLPSKVTCGENDVWCQVNGRVCRWWKKLYSTTHVLEVLGAHIHTHRKTLSPRTLTCSHTSHVPRCEKDGKAPPAKSLPKLPEGSFSVLSE